MVARWQYLRARARREGFEWEALDLRDAVWTALSYYTDEMREVRLMATLRGLAGVEGEVETALEATERALAGTRRRRGIDPDSDEAAAAQAATELLEPPVEG